VAHVMIAVDAVSHACFGLVWGDIHTRDGVVTEHHRDRPLSEPESRRWVDTAERAMEVLASVAMVTVVADRESDIYPAWARVPRSGFHLLSRAMVDRRLADASPDSEPKADRPRTLFNDAESFASAFALGDSHKSEFLRVFNMLRVHFAAPAVSPPKFQPTQSTRFFILTVSTIPVPTLHVCIT